LPKKEQDKLFENNLSK